jgi:hypothetical protein
MKQLIVVLVLLLVGCGPSAKDIQTMIEDRDNSIAIANKAIGLSERSIEIAQKWKDKYCVTLEGKQDTDCNN